MREAGIGRLVVVAPNWLGDAVMALPALADVRRASPGAVMAVAARPAVAPLFTLVPGVSEVITTAGTAAEATGAIKAGGFDGALLFPNSFHTAWTARSAGIRERWGFATDVRRLLLTRHAVPPVRVHQAGYYQHLTTALGFAPGPLIPRVEVSASQREHAAAILRTAGWDGERRLVVLAAGAAYGAAKRWPAASFAAAAARLAEDGCAPVLVGSPADAPAGDEVAAALAPGVRPVNVIGRTDLPGGNGRQILQSIHDKLLPLPETAVVVCGHGPNTTIGREKARNPFLQGL